MRAQEILRPMVRDVATVGLFHLLALYLFFGTAVPTSEPRSLALWIAAICGLYASGNALFGLYRSPAGRRARPGPARVLLSSLAAAGAVALTVIVSQGTPRVFPLRVVALAAILCSLGLLYLHLPDLRPQLALASLSVLMSLALGESFLRLVYDPLDMERQVPGTPYEKYRQILTEDPVLGFRLKPGGHAVFERDLDFYQMEVRINSMGIRDREYEVEKPPGTIRILFAGDSIVFGAGIELEQTMAKLLEDGLNAEAADGVRYQVMNWGVGSYCLRQEVGLLEQAEAVRYQPDLLLVGTGPNDFGQSLNPNTYENQTGLLATAEVQRSQSGLSDSGLRSWRLYRLADYLAGRLRSRSSGARELEASPEAASTREDIERFRDYADSLDIPLGFILFPDETYLLSNKGELDGQGSAYEIMRSQIDEIGLPYLDCLPALRAAAKASPERLFVAWDRVHYNARGNRAIALHLIDFVRRQWYPRDRDLGTSGSTRTSPR